MEKMTLPTRRFGEDLDEYRKQEIERLMQDKDVLSLIAKLGINEQELNFYLDFLIDYHDDAQYCKQCPGFEHCAKDNCHLQLTLVRKDNRIERTLRHCPLMQKIRLTDQSFIVRDFPDDWCGITLEDVDKYDYSKYRKTILKKFGDSVQTNLDLGIYLHGKPRLGKSYLMALFIQTIARDNPNKKLAFLNFPLRLRELNDLSFSDKAQFNETLQSYMDVDYLVLDDFGDEYKNDYMRDNIILPLLSSRLKEKKPTYFTSHYTFKQIIAMYGKNLASKIQSEQLVAIITAMVKEETKLEGESVY